MLAEDTSSKIYTGEFRHGIDPKNRITIPSGWRSGTGDDFYIRMDSTGSSLSVMPPAEYRARVARIEAHPGISLREKQQFIRLFSSETQACSADKQGRMVLPIELSQKIGVAGEAVLVGAYGSFEIWNPETWASTKAVDTDNYQSLAAQFGL